MNRSKKLFLMFFLLFVAALCWGVDQSRAATYGPVPGINYDIPNYAYTQSLAKFVDTLPGLGPTAANGLGNYIPVAVADTTSYGGDDYYEIALVEYKQQFHSGLPATGTKLRGYVQLWTAALPASTTKVALTQADGVTPLLVNGVQAYGVDKPRYLGPTIVAAGATRTTLVNTIRGVRIKFYNLLPTGAAGNLFIPTDTSIMGAGMGPKDAAGVDCDYMTGATCASYTQNRATLHLHGGLPAWTSDGTALQWIAPAGENTPFKKGDSAQNVPDMTIPGDGALTFHWTNQQSGRLMFYHDHAYGLTGVNVYAGEAAGYLLVDPEERKFNGDATLGIPTMPEVPLVIQDKTFVPDAATLALTDPTWDTVNWGGQGNLWYPHVYMPNQDPFNTSGATPYGRWDYGPWFWPTFPVTGLLPGSTSHVPEAFMDTPLINGQAYPYVDVPAGPVRFRILNAANDRMVNLQLYQATTATPAVAPAGFNGYTYSAACTPGTVGACTEVAMIPALPNPLVAFPDLWLTQTPGMIPDILDQRQSGVPDPALRGPAFVQIGTEAGLLPAPVVIPNTPVGFEQNKRNIVVLNVLEKSLFLAAAERADVIVDFTNFAGKTLILYNDAPAPVPASDPRYDFYTGNPDQTGGGGAASTLPGYGPNTRTIMQIRVAAGASSTAPPDDVPAFLPALQTALPAAFAATQEPLIVDPAVAVRIQDTSTVTAPAAVASATVTAGGAGYTSAPVVNFVGGGGGVGVAATATVAGGKVTGVTITSPGTGYIYAPGIIFTGGGGVGAAATTALAGAVPLLPKTIQELFDPLGRMNATLGVELPFTNAFIQTTIPLGFVDPPTETINGGETQLWKITHNGVDTHGIHFHLFNVQVVNRVGWDGAIRLPDPEEVGWKETVRMSPLEDIIIAAKAKMPLVPYGVPNSIRLLDVTRPLGAAGDMLAGTSNFSNIDPLTGNAPATPVTNVLTNFGWEYTWHCHILGHEENDMMRVLSAVVPATLPAAPVMTALTATPAAVPTQVNVAWADPTPAGVLATYGNAQNEIGFKLQRATITGNTNIGAYATVATVPANATLAIDTAITPGAFYAYQVVAYNAAGDGPPAAYHTLTIPANLPAAPASFTAAASAAGAGAPTVALTWTAGTGGGPAASFTIVRATNAGFTQGVSTFSGLTGTTYTDTSVAATTTYFYRIQAVNAGGASAWVNSTPASVTTAATLPATPTGLMSTNTTRTSVSLRWTRGLGGTQQGYQIQRAAAAGGPWTVLGTTTNTTFTSTGLTRGTTYYYQVRAYNGPTATRVYSGFSNVLQATTRP